MTSSYDSNQLTELLLSRLNQMALRVRACSSGKFRSRFDDVDVVQETCVRALRSIDSFCGTQEEEFIAWLHKILRSQLTDMYRYHDSKRRSIERESEIVSTSELRVDSRVSTPDALVMERERESLLYSALSKLTCTQQTAVRMYYLEGRKLTEVSEQLSISTSSVRRLLKLGISDLRQALASLGKERCRSLR